MLFELSNQIPPDQSIDLATADGAYDTRKCFDAFAAHGAHAKRRSQSNAIPAPCPVAAPLGSILRTRLPGNGWNGYHRRSGVETKMHCMKLTGQRLMARDFDRPVAELQVRIAVLDRCAAPCI